MSTEMAPHLERLLTRLNGAAVPGLGDLVARLCVALEEGHVCLPPGTLDAGASAQLLASRVVGRAGDFRPLVLDDVGRVYFHRYWSHEDRLARALLARAGVVVAAGRAPAGLLEGADENQRRAVENAVRFLVSVITGGPGTGKTRTASLAVAALAEGFAAANSRGRFALAAPTGKAAARLSESLAATLAGLPLSDAARAMLPAGASTLHRLLGSVPGSPEFRHCAENPLPADVVLVDEASMVALPLMARLFDAVRPDARVVLLGDKDQLASVDAGHVLGDICAGLSPGFEGPLAPCLAGLVKNYRFGAESGIQRFSAAVREGGPFLPEEAADFSPLPLPENPAREIAGRVEAWRPYLTAATPEEALARFADFRILAGVRHGEGGVEQLNSLAERALAAAGLVVPTQRFYAGRPVLVMRNDYQLRLFNGDTGIIWHDVESGELRAFFTGEDGRLRSFAPGRLPEHETAFAMTVHKAQGSEFRRVLFVLPPRVSKVLTRELLYTAATRAREHVELWWTPEVFAAALAGQVERASGLAERLWKRSV